MWGWGGVPCGPTKWNWHWLLFGIWLIIIFFVVYFSHNSNSNVQLIYDVILQNYIWKFPLKYKKNVKFIFKIIESLIVMIFSFKLIFLNYSFIILNDSIICMYFVIILSKNNDKKYFNYKHLNWPLHIRFANVQVLLNLYSRSQGHTYTISRSYWTMIILSLHFVVSWTFLYSKPQIRNF